MDRAGDTPGGLPKAYRPAEVEGPIYERWLAADVFAPDGAGSTADPALPPFVIIQPPPNVTGSLHLGHAQRSAVEDLMTRHARMLGRPALFLPGLDHASIAAQFVLDKQLAAEGESRESLGRKRYLERMREFVDRTRPVMLAQQRRVGASLDWSRLRFTMDEVSARAVRESFVRLYRDGLAYRTEALVNWCPGCLTSVSDLEVIPTPEEGTLWSVRYHLVDETGEVSPDETITVATTRPETILGDTAVAVHPGDERYRALVGRLVRIPFVDRDVPIIADEVVDREFGTGAVKITPAHDQDDYETGRRHDLPMIAVLADDGSVNAAGGPYAGMDRAQARTAILRDLEERGDLAGARPHEMLIGRCQRSNDIIEPLPRTQWFVRTGPLAEAALHADQDRPHPDPAGALRQGLGALADEHPRLERQPSALVGAPHPRLVLPGRARHGVRRADRSGRLRGLRPAGDGADPGSRHLRHVVQLGAVAVLHPRLAGADRRPRPLPPGHRHGDRLRHHLLLGRPDDDARHPADRRGPVRGHLPLRPGPRPLRPEDVEDEGQRRRPARDDRRVRGGRPSLRSHPRDRSRGRHAARAGQARERAQLREQALERLSLRPGGPTRDHPGRAPSGTSPDASTWALPSAGSCPVSPLPRVRSTGIWPTMRSAR